MNETPAEGNPLSQDFNMGLSSKMCKLESLKFSL